MSKDIPDYMRGFDLDDDWGMTPVSNMPKQETTIDSKAIDNQNLELSKVKNDVSSIKSMMNEVMQIVADKESVTKEINDEDIKTSGLYSTATFLYSFVFILTGIKCFVFALELYLALKS